jgi:hypothetical protein
MKRRSFYHRSQKKFCGHLSNRQATDLLEYFGIDPLTLTGQARLRAHGTILPTMVSESDPLRYFELAMRTELEHGSVNPLTNVTNDDMFATAQIAAAHLLGIEFDDKLQPPKPSPAYYDVLLSKML